MTVKVLQEKQKTVKNMQRKKLRKRRKNMLEKQNTVKNMQMKRLRRLKKMLEKQITVKNRLKKMLRLKKLQQKTLMSGKLTRKALQEKEPRRKLPRRRQYQEQAPWTVLIIILAVPHLDPNVSRTPTRRHLPPGHAAPTTERHPTQPPA